jgi:hypothetical protein
VVHRLVVAVTLVAAVVSLRPTLAAGEGAPVGEAMEDYFAGEQRGGLVLLAMGAAGLGSGGVLITRDSDVATGMSYPLLGLGVVHAAAGAFVILSSRARVRRFRGEVATDPGAFATTEQARMRGVQTQFFVLEIVEAVLVAGGIGLAIYGDRSDRPTLTGVGVGVAIEAAATFAFDFVAGRRAARYVGRLSVFQTRDGLTLGYGAEF